MTGNTNDFRDLLGHYVPAYSAFYELGVRAHEVLSEVAGIFEKQAEEKTDRKALLSRLEQEIEKVATGNADVEGMKGVVAKLGESEEEETEHGITWIVLNPDSDLKTARRYFVDGKGYNGEPHNIIKDRNIARVAAGKSNLDCACGIDSQGYVTHANVPLPMDTAEYRERYSLDGTFERYLEEEDSLDGLGARKASALCASAKFDDEALIITLHVHGRGGKPELSAWYRGARIDNSAGRELRTDMLIAYPKPPGVAIYEKLREAEEQEYSRPVAEEKPAVLPPAIPLAA